MVGNSLLELVKFHYRIRYILHSAHANHSSHRASSSNIPNMSLVRADAGTSPSTSVSTTHCDTLEQGCCQMVMLMTKYTANTVMHFAHVHWVLSNELFKEPEETDHGTQVPLISAMGPGHVRSICQANDFCT